jgi:DNA-binding response OmpR family regulator
MEETPRTVMVIDADILSRMAIADYLRHCGYHVIEGSSEADADAVLGAKHEVHVMLVELSLDDSQGFNLAKRLRSEQPGIDVILTSSTAKLAEKAGHLCEEGPLVKPYEHKELERRILTLRERRRQSADPDAERSKS